jgi:diacylglycerol O-acyltransferase
VARENRVCRLPSADVAFLHMDRPTNLMIINFAMLFDEPLDEEALLAVIRTRLIERYPRFRMLVRESRLGLRRPTFVEDANFKLDRHMHIRESPAPDDEEALRGLVSNLVTAPLDHSKPLWEMHLIERPGGGQALLVRVHHCIIDGIALARVIVSLTDEGRAYEDSVAANQNGSLRDGGDSATAIISLPRARELLKRAPAGARALAKLLLTPADARTALRGKLGVSRQVAWTGQLELVGVKAIARAQGATVNDVLLAAVSGALRRYLLDRGGEPRAIRTLVPVNLRPLDKPIPRELGNRFGLAFLTLPVDVAGRGERLQELSRRMSAIKRSPEGPVSYAILKTIGLTPPQVERRIVDIFTTKVSAMMTNVPGPPEVAHLTGSPLRAVQVWAPMSGSVGMSVSIFSYRGEVTIGLLADTGLVPDPQAIVGHVEQELEQLAALEPFAKPHPSAQSGEIARR